MWKIASPSAVAVVALALGGCGTVTNLSSGAPVPYGGVRSAVEAAQEDEPALGFPLNVSVNPCWVIDLGASAVADTATLPWAVWRGRRAAQEEARTLADDHGYRARFAAPAGAKGPGE